MSNENPIQSFIEAIPQVLETPAEDAPQETVAPQEPPRTPEEKEPAAEPRSKTARRLLEKERAIRAQQAEWEAKQAEYDAKLAAIEKSKEDLLVDPKPYLEALGLSPEDQKLLARIIYFEQNPEQATPDVEATLEGLKRKRWERQIEQKLAAAKAEEAKEPEPEEPEELEMTDYGIPVAHEPYFKSLADYAVAADEETFPLTAHYMSHGDAEKDEVVYSMYNLAVHHAKEQQGQGAALTPEELFKRIEAELVARRDKLVRPDTSKPEQPKTPDSAPKSLRSNSAVAAPPNPPQTGLDAEAKAKRMERALAKLQGLY